MIDDDETVREMRAAKTPPKPVPKTFMAASELRVLRATVLRVTQAKLAEQLIKPDDGRPATKGTVYLWEHGLRAVPLWAARRIRDLAEAARRYDARREG